LQQHGLEWVHSPAPLAHPLDDGTAVVLERDLKSAAAALGQDGRAWTQLMKPFVEHWSEFGPEVLRPMTSIPKHPLLLARFGMNALLSAKLTANQFHYARTRALFAGLAAHSFLSLYEPLSGAFGMLLGVLAHAVGWPFPRGGSQSLTNALCSYLATLGGEVKPSSRVDSISTLQGYDLFLCDVTPRQLLTIAAEQLSASYKRQLKNFRYGPGVFKIDFALREPIPWKAADCLRAGTVHVGGSFDDIAASETAMKNGEAAERPFVLLAQPSLFDPSRAPAGSHTAWAYCHVPNGSTIDMLPRLEAQIERFAPGFRETVLARRVFFPADLETMDANLIGGDIVGGQMDVRQVLFRPTWRGYATSAFNIYICSSSTPPGGGVHGMCGYNAAALALKKMKLGKS
jgi:phytoene dehydrogenase-like protein